MREFISVMLLNQTKQHFAVPIFFCVGGWVRVWGGLMNFSEQSLSNNFLQICTYIVGVVANFVSKSF